MLAHERFQLRFARYETPHFRYGAKVWDEVRGWVQIVGLSNGRIPWPIGKRRQKSLVVYRGLANALRKESNQAVAYWWGVTGQTVTKWRKAVDATTLTKGTLALFSANGNSPWATRGRRKAVAKSRDPGRRAKIAAARRGKKRPPHVVEAVRVAHLGTQHTATARRKMSETHRHRGTRPPKAGRPWTAKEERLLRTLPAPQVAVRTGRTLRAVYMRRRLLGMPDGRYRSQLP